MDHSALLFAAAQLCLGWIIAREGRKMRKVSLYETSDACVIAQGVKQGLVSCWE